MKELLAFEDFSLIRENLKEALKYGFKRFKSKQGGFMKKLILFLALIFLILPP